MPNRHPIPVSPDLSALLSLAAQDDELVRSALRILALEVLNESHRLLIEGSTTTKITVMRAIIPALVRTLEKKQDEDELTQMRAKMEEMMAELRGDPVAKPGSTGVVAEIMEDKPGVPTD